MNQLDRFPRPARRRVDKPLTPEQVARAEAHTGLVRGVARRVRGMVDAHLLTFEELESAGNEALVRAATRYKPKSRATFATFARYRVHGAMLDEVRKQTFGQRRHQHAWTRLTAISLERIAADGPDPEQVLEALELRGRLCAMVAGLPPQEQELIEGLYLRERQMMDFASEWGVSCATISRRHARILVRLRKGLLDQEHNRVGSEMWASRADR